MLSYALYFSTYGYTVFLIFLVQVESNLLVIMVRCSASYVCQIHFQQSGVHGIWSASTYICALSDVRKHSVRIRISTDYGIAVSSFSISLDSCIAQPDVIM